MDIRSTPTTDVASEIDVKFAGKDCTVLSVTTTPSVESVIIAQIVDLDRAWVDYPVEVFFKLGTPLPASAWPDITASSISPRLVELSTSIGSSGGSQIYANVQGVGTEDSGKLMLVDSTGVDLCQGSVQVLQYGIVQCDTIIAPYTTPTTVGVKDISGVAPNNNIVYDNLAVTYGTFIGAD